MPMDRYITDAEFAPAPAGLRVRLTTLLSAVVGGLVAVGLAVLMLRDPHVPGLVLALVAVVPAVLALYWLAARIDCYRLVGSELRIEFRFRTVRFSLAGLTDATPDREAMRRSVKIFGNEGLGAISGRFRSKRLGAFRAYLSDSDRAVVLRWPDRCLVISPEQHSYFVEAVRKRAGLSR